MRRPRLFRLLGVLTRVLAYAVLTVGVVVGLTLLAAETSWGKDRIRALIVRLANRSLTATLEIHAVEGSLFRGLELKDVRLSRNGETIIGIDEVALDYRIRELLQQRVVVGRLI